MSLPSVVAVLQFSLVFLPLSFSVQLVASDRYGLEADYLSLVGDQVRWILRGAGVEAHWASGEPSTVAAARRHGPGVGDDDSVVAPEIEVIFAAGSPESWGAKRRAMGTVVPTAHPRRQVIVFPERVLQVLDRDRPGLPPNFVYTEETARAFARVVVHEVVHALVPDHSHADHGLMRGSLSRKFLLGSTLPLDASCRGAIDDLVRRAGAGGDGGAPPG